VLLLRDLNKINSPAYFIENPLRTISQKSI